jgi:hypothetical protein
MTMLLMLGFTEDTAKYLTRNAGLHSLDKVAYLDGDDDVENLTKRVSCPFRTTNIGTGSTEVTTPHAGCDVSIRADSNLKLGVFCVKRQERVSRKPTVGIIDLALVRSCRDQQKWEENFKKTMVEPVLNGKDWPQTLDNIHEYATDPADIYLMVD